MNNGSDTRGTSNTASTMMGFALGAVVGAGLALLLAPESGRQTRQRLAETAQRWKKSAGETMDHARETVAELGVDAKSAMRAGKDSFKNDRAASRDARADGRMSAVDATPGHMPGRSNDEAVR